MTGGWGGGSWGGLPWGGSQTGGILQTVAETVTVTENLTVEVPFEVDAAVGLFPFLVRVDFTGFVDPGHAPNFDPSNYVIPGLTVYGVVAHPTFGKSVLLLTSEQLAVVYTLTVDVSTQGLGGDLMNPFANTANFNGFPIAPTFMATAQSDTKVQVIFIPQMTVDAELTNTANYTLKKIDGTVVALTSITVLDNRHVEIITATSLEPWAYYALTINSNVRTLDNQTLYPDTDVFQWAKYQPLPIEVEFEKFTGESTGGLLGTPAGQVFVSPALETALANSILQIDEISVCTRAYDVYEVPEIPDPPVLYTFPAPDTVQTTSLLNEGVLWAPAERLGLARTDLVDTQEDTYTPPTDGPADATLVETIDITTGGFLNDPRWETFPAATASIGVFTTANNLAPIGPGPTTNINLQP